MSDQPPIHSYTVGQADSGASELLGLLRRSRRVTADLADDVRRLIDTCAKCEQLLRNEIGIELKDRDCLEIGPGQLPRQTAYFAARNRVTGIDLDVIPRGWNVGSYYRLLRANGMKRLIKTVGRKLIGFDRRFNREMLRQLSLPAMPHFTALQMDARNLAFPDASFDVVYSFDVFEHLPDPAAVLREIRRVLRPGGAMLQYVHPYTAFDGCHDLRITPATPLALPAWPHLRPEHRHLVRQQAFLNYLSIAQWKEVFAAEMPGSTVAAWSNENPSVIHALADVRGAGGLAEYGDAELLTDRIVAVWKKPGDLRP